MPTNSFQVSFGEPEAVSEVRRMKRISRDFLLKKARRAQPVVVAVKRLLVAF